MDYKSATHGTHKSIDIHEKIMEYPIYNMALDEDEEKYNKQRYLNFFSNESELLLQSIGYFVGRYKDITSITEPSPSIIFPYQFLERLLSLMNNYLPDKDHSIKILSTRLVRKILNLKSRMVDDLNKAGLTSWIENNFPRNDSVRICYKFLRHNRDLQIFLLQKSPSVLEQISDFDLKTQMNLYTSLIYKIHENLPKYYVYFLNKPISVFHLYSNEHQVKTRISILNAFYTFNEASLQNMILTIELNYLLMLRDQILPESPKNQNPEEKEVEEEENNHNRNHTINQPSNSQRNISDNNCCCRSAPCIHNQNRHITNNMKNENPFFAVQIKKYIPMDQLTQIELIIILRILILFCADPPNTSDYLIENNFVPWIINLYHSNQKLQGKRTLSVFLEFLGDLAFYSPLFFDIPHILVFIYEVLQDFDNFRANDKVTAIRLVFIILNNCPNFFFGKLLNDLFYNMLFLNINLTDNEDRLFVLHAVLRVFNECPPDHLQSLCENSLQNEDLCIYLEESQSECEECGKVVELILQRIHQFDEEC
ncbi:hypothetical protein TRFO_13276 [Tritrichomonas foetus]|uniref:Uncharacterized protein n=1 Tax=Tritrichomonas foetus TaxID=1144522 RepID=A0A1J4KYF8_9EUKA|nr:hypothetical protein TRFO_13276 [Tritrichomonas foetus]|eukprot:OHT16271.1 hypothetical protein TRFO_13276 [Tritrichomonas foetus]